MPRSVRENLLKAAALDPGNRVMAAFDNDTVQEAYINLEEFGHLLAAGKVNSLADAHGAAELAERIHPYTAVFVDYKLHDIDETMFKRARNLARAGADIITLHALADVEPMKRAVKGVEAAVKERPNMSRPMLAAVTVLTSHKEERCVSLFGEGRKEMVKKLAYMAVDAGVEALVCSPEEAEMIKSDSFTEDLVVITPAIRPLWAAKPDEQHTAKTPTLALQAGADFLVIGRPLIESHQYGMTGEEAFMAVAEEMRRA